MLSSLITVTVSQTITTISIRVALQDWTGNLNVTYTRPISAYVNLLLNAEWSYRGDVYYDVFNTDGAFQSGFSIVNANLGLVDASPHLSPQA